MSDLKDDKRKQALTEAVEAHRPRLLSMIGGRVRDQVEAEDIFQEVFEEFMASYDLGQAIETIGAWLGRVAQNKVIDRFRRRKTHDEYRKNRLLDEIDIGGSRPDEEWTRTWIRQQLAEALETLPAEQRDVFIRHELEGKSFEEIAGLTGESVNTLLSRKRYAVLALREYLQEVYDELES